MNPLTGWGMIFAVVGGLVFFIGYCCAIACVIGDDPTEVHHQGSGQ